MNLLHDALFGCTYLDGTRRLLTLPQLFAEWDQATEVRLAGLKAPQRPAVEATFAQFAAHAREVNGLPPAPQTTANWRAALENLASAEGAPTFWDLSQPNLSCAAFMQAPLSSAALLRRPLRSVQDLETLVLSKNHDVKADAHAQGTPDHWVYALIALQTTSGYTGPTQYGICRMNGGYGTRVFHAAYVADTQGGRWREDVQRLLAYWQTQYTSNPFGYTKAGRRLLAAVAWDGVTQLSLQGLHPGFVEICRPLRLATTDDVVTGGQIGGSKSARIGGTDALAGCVGDPWTPQVAEREGAANKKNRTAPVTYKSLSPSTSGFNWGHFLGLLFSDNVMPAAFGNAAGSTRPVVVRLSGLARGQGQTNGYQDFAFTLPVKLVHNLFAPRASSQYQRLLLRQHRGAEVAEALVKRADFAYQLAHAPIDPTPQELKRVSDATHHEAVRADLRAQLTGYWQEHMLPWLSRESEADADDATAVTHWFADVRAHVLTCLQKKLAPRVGAVRANPLALAKALAAIPSTCPATTQ